jgi:hypothetical protein
MRRIAVIGKFQVHSITGAECASPMSGIELAQTVLPSTTVCAGSKTYRKSSVGSSGTSQSEAGYLDFNDRNGRVLI